MFDSYKVAVKLSLVNGVSGGLSVLAGQFAAINKQAGHTQNNLTHIEQKLKNIKTLTLVGGAMAGAGFFGLSLLKGPYEEAKKLAQAKADFENLNLSTTNNQKVYGLAATLSHQRLGSTITDNIKLMQDLHTATGDLGKSLGLADAYTQFSIAAKVQNGGHDVDGLVSNSIKALEHRGDRVMQNKASTLYEMNRQSQVHFATKGRVSPSDYFQMSQTGKMAYTMADADFLYGPMAAMIQAKTGATAGTAQMTTMSSLVGGHMTKKAIGFLRGMGLWQDQESPLTKGLKNSVNNDPLVKKIIAANGDVAIQSGGLPDWAAHLAMSNTDKFTREILVPAIRKKYGMNMTDEQVGLLLTKEFNRNTADNLSFWVLNQQKVAKDSALINRSKGFGSAYKAYMKSPEGAEEAASAAWKNFLAVFGSIYLPQITKGLLSLASGLDTLATWATAHPNIFKGLIYAFAGLSTLVAVGGVLTLTTTALSSFGLIVGGGLAASVSGLVVAMLPFAGAIVAVGAALYGIKWLLDWSHETKPKTALEASNAARLKVADDAYAHERKRKWNDFSIDPIAKPSQKAIQVHSTIKIGEKTLIETVTTHFAKQASKPQSGISSFDASQMAPHPSFN